MGERKLTKAQKGLVALMQGGFDPRYIDRQESDRRGLLWAYEAALRGQLIRSAGMETTVAAEDWLNSPEGRSALEAST